MVEFITSALRSDNSMSLLYMWMFVIVTSADFKTQDTYSTSNSHALGLSSHTGRSKMLIPYLLTTTNHFLVPTCS